MGLEFVLAVISICLISFGCLFIVFGVKLLFETLIDKLFGIVFLCLGLVCFIFLPVLLKLLLSL